MSLGLLLLFVTISTVNLSLGFFLGRMFHGAKVASGDAHATEGQGEAHPAAEKSHGQAGHH